MESSDKFRTSWKAVEKGLTHFRETGTPPERLFTALRELCGAGNAVTVAELGTGRHELSRIFRYYYLQAGLRARTTGKSRGPETVVTWGDFVVTDKVSYRFVPKTVSACLRAALDANVIPPISKSDLDLGDEEVQQFRLGHRDQAA